MSDYFLACFSATCTLFKLYVQNRSTSIASTLTLAGVWYRTDMCILSLTLYWRLRYAIISLMAVKEWPLNLLVQGDIAHSGNEELGPGVNRIFRLERDVGFQLIRIRGCADQLW